MEENSRAMCERMQYERDTLKGKLEDERKVIFERAKLSEESDQLRFQSARLLWYDAQLKSAEKVKLQLQQDFEAAKSSAKTPAETEELLKLRKENQILLLKLTNFAAKSEGEKEALKVKVTSPTKALETETDLVVHYALHAQGQLYVHP